MIVLRKIGSVSFSKGGCCLVNSIRSLFLPGRANQAAQIADGRLGLGQQRAQPAEEHVEVLGGGLGLGHQYVEVVERRAQVHERGVALPQGVGQHPESPVEGHVLITDGRCRGVRVAHELFELAAALRDSPHGLRRIHDEPIQELAVEGQLLCDSRGRRQRRAEVLQGLAVLLRPPAEVRGVPLDELLQAAARLGIERVEELVEVDGRDGVFRPEVPRPRFRRRCSGPGRARRSGSRCPTARLRGWWPSCLRATGRCPRRRPSSRPQPDRHR